MLNFLNSIVVRYRNVSFTSYPGSKYSSYSSFRAKFLISKLYAHLNKMSDPSQDSKNSGLNRVSKLWSIIRHLKPKARSTSRLKKEKAFDFKLSILYFFLPLTLFITSLMSVLSFLSDLSKWSNYSANKNKFKSDFFNYSGAAPKKPKLDYYKKDVTSYFLKKKIRLQRNDLQNSNVFFISDSIILSVFTLVFKKINFKYTTPRIELFLKQVSWDFYGNRSRASISNQKKTTYEYFLIGLSAIWGGIRYWALGLALSVFILLYFLQLKGIPINKTFFGYFVVGTFIYWLLSGFVFFIKKYQYSKFTTVIQRFWKRTFIIFWMIEASVFVVFFYLTLNASEEPLYMYDQSRIYKTHLFSWRSFLSKLLPFILLLVLSFYLSLSVRWGLYSRQSFLIFFLTLLVVYIFWVEFYQFYNVVSYYGNFYWIYDYDEFLWSIELDDRRTRIANNYVAICLIAKFWHIVFMFIFWVFFVLRVNEYRRVRYQLVAANFQNFLILYIISWVYMYPWLKYLFRKQLDSPYYWFNLSFRRSGLRVLLNDFGLHLNAIFERISQNFSYGPLMYTPFYYWYTTLDSNSVGNFFRVGNHGVVLAALQGLNA